MHSSKLFSIIFCAFFFCSSYAQEKESITKKVYTTKFLNENDAPTIDGIIDEKSWDIVDWTGDYIENEPDENTPSTEQTTFKVVYDKH